MRLHLSIAGDQTTVPTRLSLPLIKAQPAPLADLLHQMRRRAPASTDLQLASGTNESFDVSFVAECYPVYFSLSAVRRPSSHTSTSQWVAATTALLVPVQVQGRWLCSRCPPGQLSF